MDSRDLLSPSPADVWTLRKLDGCSAALILELGSATHYSDHSALYVGVQEYTLCEVEKSPVTMLESDCCKSWVQSALKIPTCKSPVHRKGFAIALPRVNPHK